MNTNRATIAITRLTTPAATCGNRARDCNMHTTSTVHVTTLHITTHMKCTYMITGFSPDPFRVVLCHPTSLCAWCRAQLETHRRHSYRKKRQQATLKPCPKHPIKLHAGAGISKRGASDFYRDNGCRALHIDFGNEFGSIHSDLSRLT